ncbi:hypothetical protein [Burkholderia sp. LMG 32019]|uniref:hypothetical protein n=1 Tax=Burkholderia sp. LMG 32019 TaxID=3158173 RepID=UPI003C2EA3D8
MRDANPDARVIITAGSYRDASPPAGRRYAAWLDNAPPDSARIERHRRSTMHARSLATATPLNPAPCSVLAVAWRQPFGAGRATGSQNRQYFTMWNKSLRCKNSWCRAQISRFAMPKNVPQYKTSKVIICF